MLNIQGVQLYVIQFSLLRVAYKNSKFKESAQNDVCMFDQWQRQVDE